MKGALRLITVNVAVFALLKVAWMCLPAAGDGMERIVAWLALPADARQVAVAPWTAISYMFTHIDFWHLLVNCLWIAWFGSLLSEIAGMRMMAAVYLAGGLAGGAAYVTFSSLIWHGSDACLVGASAATLAVVTATLISEPGKRVQMTFIGTFSLRKLALAGGVVFLFACMEMAPQQTAAHIGGIAAGALMATVWKIYNRRNMRVMEQRTRRRLDRIELLEKARTLGYASLSDEERLRLFDLSADISGNKRMQRR